MSKEKEIKELLLKTGISPQHNGYSYLVEAITICCKNPAVRFLPTGQLYNLVAEKFNTDASVVTQAIRRAIRNAYYNPNSYLSGLFDYHHNKDKFPTALEFITRLSDIILGGNNET